MTKPFGSQSDRATELPVLDQQFLDEITMSDRDFAQEIAALFVQDTACQLAKLKAAIKGENWNQCAKQAHHIKGAAANVGGAQMSSVAKELEQACKQNEKDRIIQIHGLLEASYAQLRSALEKAFERLMTD